MRMKSCGAEARFLRGSCGRVRMLRVIFGFCEGKALVTPGAPLPPSHGRDGGGGAGPEPSGRVGGENARGDAWAPTASRPDCRRVPEVAASPEPLQVGKTPRPTRSRWAQNSSQKQGLLPRPATFRDSECRRSQRRKRCKPVPESVGPVPKGFGPCLDRRWASGLRREPGVRRPAPLLEAQQNRAPDVGGREPEGNGRTPWSHL